MIETLARKRTNVRLSHLTALAVLAALVAAMFVAMQSASAAPALTISIGDSDNVVKAGTGHDINLFIKDGATDESGSWTVDYITATGGVVVTNASVDDAVTAGAGDDDEEANLAIPGSASGKYTISARVKLTSDTTKTLEADLVITVGDPGTSVGSVELELDKFHMDGKTATDDGAFTCGPVEGGSVALAGAPVEEKESQKTDTNTAPAGTEDSNTGICLVATVKNSLGSKPNIDDVTRVTFITPGAEADSSSFNTAGDGGATAFTTGEIGTADGGITQRHTLKKADPGTVKVRVIVFGKGGAVAESDELVLTFTGDPSTIMVADATTTLHYSTVADAKADDDDDDTTEDDSDTDNGEDPNETDENDPPTIRLQVTATDKGGNVATVPGADYESTIKDADGEEVLSSKISVATSTTTEKGKSYLVVTGHGTDTAKLATGEYTIEVTNGDLKDSAMFTVSGGAAGIALEVSSATVSVGEVVKVTATVTDADGNTVIDNTEVTIEAAGALDLRILGGGANNMVTEKTKAGEVSARALVSKGSGSASFVVSTGNVYETISVSTEAAEEAAPEEVSLDCLSSNTGFSSYTCSMGSSASELFGLLSGRGATAIHLWNGSMWVRYAVVDGAEIPGSSDFTVAEDDILYISN